MIPSANCLMKLFGRSAMETTMIEKPVSPKVKRYFMKYTK